MDSTEPPPAPYKSKSVDELFLDLIRLRPPPHPTTKQGVLEYFHPRLKAIGFAGTFGKNTKVIHVAGTKGKGSVCAMVESILRARGLRTGLFTSPHLVSVTERFRICGQPVEESVLRLHFEKVYNQLKKQDLVPGFFAFVALVAFDLFSKSNLDVVILEVGIGGRLDTTNIITPVSVCGVTLLDLDHIEFLGDTIEKIAAEKAGIFKPRTPVFVVEGQEESALQVLKSHAEKHESPLTIVPAASVLGFKLSLHGEYQKTNAALAVALCKSCLPSLSEDHIRDGLGSCSWPGRCQIIQFNDRLRILLDGAHTPKSVDYAISWLKSVSRTNDRSVLIFNCMHSRDPKHFFELFVKHNVKFDKVLFAPGLVSKPTAVSQPDAKAIIGKDVDSIADGVELTWQDTLRKVWIHTLSVKDGESVISCKSIQEACDRVKSEDMTSTTLFVTGSLLLIGDFLKTMKINVFEQ